MRERLNAKEMSLVVTKPAMELLMEKGYNPEFGARPLRRAIERWSRPLSEEMLRSKFKAGDTVVIRVNGDVLVFEPEPREAPPSPPPPRPAKKRTESESGI